MPDTDEDLPTWHLWVAFRAIGKADFDSRADALHAAAYAQYHLEQFIEKVQGEDPIGIEQFDEEEQDIIREFVDHIRHYDGSD